MKKPGHNPDGQVPARLSPAAKAAAGHRRRMAALSIGVSALLALGGVVWAAGLPVASRSGGAQGAGPADAAATAPDAGAPVATVPDPAMPGAPAPVQAPVLPAPAVADPPPVDRTGKSEEELATIPQPAAPAVDLKAKKTVKGGVSATITETAAVRGEAKGLGEVAGPAIRFKVTVFNDTAAPLRLDRAVVDVSYGDDGTPASQLSGPDPVVFPASVAPGESGAGVFVFAVPLDARDKVRIHFNLEAETPVATFAGAVPA